MDITTTSCLFPLILFVPSFGFYKEIEVNLPKKDYGKCRTTAKAASLYLESRREKTGGNLYNF
jgi:hypothetical protein